MKRCLFVSLLLIVMSGCTLPSTRLAQAGSFRSQAVNDGVHKDVVNALCREEFESAKQTILLNAEKAKKGQPEAVAAAIDQAALENIAALKEFAKKRDMVMSWDRDHERANALKYVTVDAKLFSEQGILNYLGNQLSSGSKQFLNAWDNAKEEWNNSINGSSTTQPSN